MFLSLLLLLLLVNQNTFLFAIVSSLFKLYIYAYINETNLTDCDIAYTNHAAYILQFALNLSLEQDKHMYTQVLYKFKSVMQIQQTKNVIFKKYIYILFDQFVKKV